MKALNFIITILLCTQVIKAQSVQDTVTTVTAGYQNAAERMMITDRKLTIGGYAQIDYNQPINADTYNNGVLDVHRLVMLFGYKFNNRTQFITEIEYEHVSEVYIEQAFVDYKLNNYMNLRAGLMLIPMGIVNEYHEPPTFLGVERPMLDNYIVPTTWREIGIGFTGTIPNANLKYQAYVVNGFKSFDETPTLRGSDALRKGRQKGEESFMNAPNFATKVEYFGFKGLNIGLSGYLGNTQSTLYNGIEKDDAAAVARADSSVVGVAMIGIDTRYTNGGLHLRGQWNYGSISNTVAYNNLSYPNGKPNDLGSAISGYYAEAGYNIFSIAKTIKTELIPFVRYSEFDTHTQVAGELKRNDKYNRIVITTGIGWKVAPGAIFKADIQFLKTKGDHAYSKIFNAGVGIWF